MKVGGSTDPESNQAVGTCTVSNMPVQSLNMARGSVGLAVASLRSEQMAAYAKDYVFAFGGCCFNKASKAVERYSIKADMWMSLPDMNIARISPTGIIIQDYLYVFGGKTEQLKFINKIERLNLKNLQSKFELIDI